MARKFKQPRKKYKSVGNNKTIYNKDADTYESAYSLNPVTVAGDKTKYNPIGRNVANAQNRFAMNYLYPALQLSGAGMGISAFMANPQVAAGITPLLLGHFYGLGAGKALDDYTKKGTFNPFVPMPAGKKHNINNFYSPNSRKFYNSRKRLKVK